MIFDNVELRQLIAPDGLWLYDGVFLPTKMAYLGCNSDIATWRYITEEEYQEIISKYIETQI